MSDFYQDSVHQLLTPAAVEAPTVVCLDEFAILKSHKYGLHLMDALTGHVWQVTPGRSRYLEHARKRTTFRGTHKQGRHAQLETWLANDPALQDLYKSLQDMRSVRTPESRGLIIELKY